MEFRKYTLDDLETVRFYSAKVETLSYYYTACNIDLYSKAKDIYIAEEESLFVYFNKDKVFLMPFTEKSNINKALSRLYSYTQKNGLDFKVIDIPEEYYPYIDQEKFSLRRDRDSDEYIYLREKLITLQGKHLQSKRNHISQFVKAYPEFSISKLTKENYSECIQMDEVWLKNSKEEYRSALLEELECIKRVERVFDRFEFSGALLYVKDELVAFTLAEKNQNEVVVYFEKANTDYIGSYTMINREYQLNYAPHVNLVNRQEDVGAEGLRRAKESYQPYRMLEKYILTVR